MPTSATCVFHNFLRNLSFLSSIANLFHRREPITLQVSMLNIHMTPAHLCIVLILYFGVDGNQARLIHHGTIECGGAETFVASVNTCYSFISNWMAGVCGKWIVKELSLMCILLISLIQGWSNKCLLVELEPGHCENCNCQNALICIGKHYWLLQLNESFQFVWEFWTHEPCCLPVSLRAHKRKATIMLQGCTDLRGLFLNYFCTAVRITFWN